jgi:uncharacterized protein (TIGR02271 family)
MQGYPGGGWKQMRRHAHEAWEFGRESGHREDETTLELREEQLRARKETTRAGEVQLRKEVVTERQAMDVPVTREEVYIERRDVEPRPAGRPIGEGQTINVPVHEERVTVDKQAVVTGEVEVGKRAVQETRRVEGEVRREEARIETDGDVELRGDGNDLKPSDGKKGKGRQS